jgi:hypothetical protein
VSGMGFGGMERMMDLERAKERIRELEARLEGAERKAEKRKRHIELVVQRLRDAGGRIHNLERALPHWANVPNLETARRRIETLEAQCAAMREALEQRGCEESHVDKNGAVWRCSSETPMDPCRTCRSLGSDAGKVVLERLAHAEAVAKSALEHAALTRGELYPCEAHAGLRRACGQCYDSALERLAKAEKDLDKAIEDIGSWERNDFARANGEDLVRRMVDLEKDYDAAQSRARAQAFAQAAQVADRCEQERRFLRDEISKEDPNGARVQWLECKRSEAERIAAAIRALAKEGA